MLSIWSSLAELPDPRSGNARRHKLLDILTIALTASICGAESCVDFADFARDREALFREFLELPGGLPSHDTFSRLFRLLDPAAFATCFASFLDNLGQDGTGVVAIDGKAMRRSFDRATGKSALHVATAFAADARMTIGQVAARDKESEITAACQSALNIGSDAIVMHSDDRHHGAPSRRGRSKSRLALPYICRFTSFSFVFWPSV